MDTAIVRVLLCEDDLELIIDAADLDGTIPVTDGEENSVLVVWISCDSKRCSPRVALDLLFALTTDGPNADCLVSRSGEDTTVVRADSDGKNVLLMTAEKSGGGTLVDIPDTSGLIPAGCEQMGCIGREASAGNEVVMTLKADSRLGIGVLHVLDVPNKSSLVS